MLAQRTARKPCALCPSRDYAMTHVASACIRTLRQSTAVHNKRRGGGLRHVVPPLSRPSSCSRRPSQRPALPHTGGMQLGCVVCSSRDCGDAPRVTTQQLRLAHCTYSQDQPCLNQMSRRGAGLVARVRWLDPAHQGECIPAGNAWSPGAQLKLGGGLSVSAPNALGEDRESH